MEFYKVSSFSKNSGGGGEIASSLANRAVQKICLQCFFNPPGYVAMFLQPSLVILQCVCNPWLFGNVFATPWLFCHVFCNPLGYFAMFLQPPGYFAMFLPSPWLFCKFFATPWLFCNVFATTLVILHRGGRHRNTRVQLNTGVPGQPQEQVTKAVYCKTL